MDKKKTNRIKTGQSTLEMVVLFIVIAAAFILMQRYIKRAAMGKFRESAQQISQGQFDPLAINEATSQQSQNVTFSELSTSDGETRRTYTQKSAEASSVVDIGEISNYTDLGMDAY